MDTKKSQDKQPPYDSADESDAGTDQGKNTSLSVDSDSKEPRAALIKLNYNSKDSLYMSYIPLLKRGGVFVPTSRAFKIHTALRFQITLPGISDVFLCKGKVVWITPKNAESGAPQGIGVHFDESSVTERFKILVESILVVMGNKKSSYTL